MDLRVKIDGRMRVVKITRGTSGYQFSLDGNGVAADVVQAGAGVFSVLFDGKSYEARLAPDGNGARVVVDGNEFLAELEDPRKWKRGSGAAGAHGRQNIAAPMPGRVIRVLVKEGEKVALGQGVLIVEAMKMQNEIKSPKEGTIERIHVREGVPVNSGQVLMVIA